MISSEMPELLAHSDRIMVMNKGRILATFQQPTQEMIMSLIMEDIIKNKIAACN
jgi:ABC-type sugar transport system ATPase subunit